MPRPSNLKRDYLSWEEVLSTSRELHGENILYFNPLCKQKGEMKKKKGEAEALLNKDKFLLDRRTCIVSLRRSTEYN